VKLLFENPYCKVEFIVNGLGIERKAASRYLHQLSEIKILELKKIGRENIFINEELMEILKK
jgi:Fic family protein